MGQVQALLGVQNVDDITCTDFVTCLGCIQSALDATQTGYEVGTRNIVDVLNAQQSLYLSQFQYAKARYTYVIDTLLLKQSVGTLNPEDLYALSRFLDDKDTISRNTPTTR